MGGKGQRRREKNYRAAHGGSTRLPPPPDPSSFDALPSKLRKILSFSGAAKKPSNATKINAGGGVEKKQDCWNGFLTSEQNMTAGMLLALKNLYEFESVMPAIDGLHSLFIGKGNCNRRVYECSITQLLLNCNSRQLQSVEFKVLEWSLLFRDMSNC